MSIELAEKIKAMARQQIDTAALVDKLEARISVLEDANVREFTVGNAESAYVNAQNGFGDAVLKVEKSLADTLKIPEKRGRGRPKKGS